MKNAPTILMLLCTNLFWSYSLNAMEEQVVLDKRPGQKLVLTDLGRAKAESLQLFHEQQQRRVEPSHVGFIIPEGYDEDLATALAMSQSSPESVENSEHGPTPRAIDSTSTIVKEDDDPILKDVLSKSALEYETRRKKVAEAMEQLEKERAKKRAEFLRERAIRELKEVREIQERKGDELRSKIDELEAQRTQLLESKLLPSTPTDDKFQSPPLPNDDVKAISLQLSSLYDQLSSFSPINSLIHEEIMYLLEGGEPRETPWMVELRSSSAAAQAAEREISPSLNPANFTFPAIPSSALPTFNSDSLEKK